MQDDRTSEQPEDIPTEDGVQDDLGGDLGVPPVPGPPPGVPDADGEPPINLGAMNPD